MPSRLRASGPRPLSGRGLGGRTRAPAPRPLELGLLRPPHLVSPVAVPLGRRGRTRHAPGPRGPKPGARQGGGGRARRGTPAAASVSGLQSLSQLDF